MVCTVCQNCKNSDDASTECRECSECMMVWSSLIFILILLIWIQVMIFRIQCIVHKHKMIGFGRWNVNKGFRNQDYFTRLILLQHWTQHLKKWYNMNRTTLLSSIDWRAMYGWAISWAHLLLFSYVYIDDENGNVEQTTAIDTFAVITSIQSHLF